VVEPFMKPAAFDYVAAASVEAAVAALRHARGEGKILAGGQSLVPLLNFRLVRPTTLIDINRVPNLASIEATEEAITVGALTRHHALETSPLIKTHLPVVAAAMPHVAHLAIRNRGTIGGSLAHADPAAELPMLAVLLDARIGIAGANGRRVAEARDFFRGALTTCLGEDEIITDIAFPRVPVVTGWAFEEVARRRGDFALAAVGVTLSVRDGAAARARIALLGASETPMRATAAEALLCGRALEAPVIAQAAAAVQADARPNADLKASAALRHHLLGVLAKRAIVAAWRRALAAAQDPRHAHT
jgi:CO/xanthine dehydrogenase FAD-binding subunit